MSEKKQPIQMDNYIDYSLELAHSPVLCSKKLPLECREPGARPAATIVGGTDSGCWREYGFWDCTPSLGDSVGEELEPEEKHCGITYPFMVKCCSENGSHSSVMIRKAILLSCSDLSWPTPTPEAASSATVHQEISRESVNGADCFSLSVA